MPTLAVWRKTWTEARSFLSGPSPPLPAAWKSLPRLICHPPVPFRGTPRGCSVRPIVLIMPYADLPVTRAMQPLKLKEYLATGKPVVVRELPSTRPWADCLDVVATPEAFSLTVRNRLETGLAHISIEPENDLADEAWSRKAQDFESWILASDLDAESDRDVPTLAASESLAKAVTR